MAEYAVLHDGHLIQDSTWACVADVMRGAHGQGSRVAQGVLVSRESGGEWVEHYEREAG